MNHNSPSRNIFGGELLARSDACGEGRTNVKKPNDFLSQWGLWFWAAGPDSSQPGAAGESAERFAYHDA